MADHEYSTACNGSNENLNQRENSADESDASNLLLDASSTETDQIDSVSSSKGTTSTDLDRKVLLELESLETGNFREERNPPERFWSVLLATLVAAMGPLSIGYSLGYSSAAVTQLDRPTANASSTELYLTFQEITWFGSLLNIGAMIGGPLAGQMIDYFGRKPPLIMASVPYAVGYLLMGFAKNVPMLYSGRFLSGLAVGMTSLNVPVYIAEITSAKQRGNLGTVFQTALSMGVLFSYVVGDQMTWRWSAIVGSFPAAVLFVFMIFMPETPRWLVALKREKKAKNNLLWLRGPHREVDTEISNIKDSLSNRENMRLKEFFRPSIIRSLVISLALMFFQQFGGINAMMFYSANIFERAGFTNSTFVAIFIALIQFVTSVISCFLMDKVGRRLMLLIATVGMAIGCVVLGTYFFALTIFDISWISVTSLAIYIVGFVLGWGPCPWLMMSELFPVAARGKASGIATFFNWFCAFVVTKVFKYMLVWLTPAGTFWFFTFVMLVALVFVYKVVPETKGKSLEEIQLYFEKKKSCKHVQEAKV